MNYTDLKAKVQLFVEDYEPGFIGSIDSFIQTAEQRIYTLTQMAATRQEASLELSPGVKTLTVPVGFKSVLDFRVLTDSIAVSLLVKDPSFLREAYPDDDVEAFPIFYAQVAPYTLRVAPVPDDLYSVELEYFGFPESIVTAENTWLGDNYDHVLLYGTLIEAASFLKLEEDTMKDYNSKFAAGLQMLKQQVDGRASNDEYRSGKEA